MAGAVHEGPARRRLDLQAERTLSAAIALAFRSSLLNLSHAKWAFEFQFWKTKSPGASVIWGYPASGAPMVGGSPMPVD